MSVAAISIQVSYRLGEYMSCVQEFVPASPANKVQHANGRGGLLAHPTVVKVSLWILVPPIFLTKVLRVGRCEFDFTNAGFSRTSRGHTAFWSWQEVVAVHTLSRVYLIELEKGAMPVPFRVFAPSDQERFEALIPHSLLCRAG